MGELEYVGTFLTLGDVPIESLGNLKYVGGDLFLYNSHVSSFGDLEYIGGYLNIEKTPLSRKYTEDEIRSMIQVGEYIEM